MLIKKNWENLRQATQKLPVRWVVVIPFVTQVTLAVSLTGWLSFLSGEKAVKTLTYQLQQETAKRVISNLSSYQAIPHQINLLNSHQIELGTLSLEDLPAWEKYLWKQVQVFPQVNLIAIASEEGEQVTATNLGGGEIVMPIAYRSLGTSMLTYKTNSLGEKTTIATTTPNYDPRKRPWYQKAAKTGKAAWSDIYLHFVDRTPQISAVLPFYNQENRLIGVGTTVVKLKALSEFLSTLQVGKTGQVLIIEPDGNLVATSTGESLSRKVGDKTQRVNIIDSNNSITQAVGKYLQQIVGEQKSLETSRINSSKNIEVMLGDRAYFIEITSIQDNNGLKWQVLVIISEEEFLEQIIANNQRTLILCIIALVVTLIVGIKASSWIVRPIESLSASLNQVTQGNLDQSIIVAGNGELRTLATNFNQMIATVRSSRSNLQDYNQQLETTLEELKTTQLQLVQNEKMSSLGQLVAGVAHEINNPVNFIAGNISYAQSYVEDILLVISIYQKYHSDIADKVAGEMNDQDIDLEFIQEDLLKVLTSMKTGTDRIQAIVKSLRNFSRLDEAEVKDVDIHEGIDSTLLILQSRFQGKGSCPAIEVCKYYGNLPLIECYPGQLNQVFMNLLVNAIDALEEKFSQQDPQNIDKNNRPKITITTSVLDEQKISIKIADNAGGMPETIQGRIFDPFFTTKPIGKGTGLGLAISYKIITETHQGNLECISQSSHGTEFIITLLKRLTFSRSD